MQSLPKIFQQTQPKLHGQRLLDAGAFTASPGLLL
jgi:hypothetical protein